MNDRSEWFAAKRYGLGAGLPIAWQGWLVFGLYLALVFGAVLLFGARPAPLAAAIVPATLLFILVAARTTRGGWRWRWGDSD